MRNDLESGIDSRANTDLRTLTELADIVEFLITNGYTPARKAIKTPDLTAACPAASYSRLQRLHSEMGMVQKYSQGPNAYLIHTRLDEIVNGQGVSQMVNEELKRVSDHAKVDPQIRQIIADARDVSTSQALHGLWDGDFGDRQRRLVTIVSAIQNEPSVTQGDYGMIVFRNPANLYSATSLAVQLYEK